MTYSTQTLRTPYNLQFDVPVKSCGAERDSRTKVDNQRFFITGVGSSLRVPKSVSLIESIFLDSQILLVYFDTMQFGHTAATYRRNIFGLY